MGMVPTCDVMSTAPRYSSCTKNNGPRVLFSVFRRFCFFSFLYILPLSSNVDVPLIFSCPADHVRIGLVTAYNSGYV